MKIKRNTVSVSCREREKLQQHFITAFIKEALCHYPHGAGEAGNAEAGGASAWWSQDGSAAEP